MNALLAEGLTDAIGFVAGSLLGLWIARTIGFDPFTGTMDNSAMVGILACGIGGGAGVQVARRVRAAMRKKEGSD
jgi:hypothetical protein